MSSRELSKEIDTKSSITSETTTVSNKLDPVHVLMVADFFKATCHQDPSLEDFTDHDDFSVLFQSNIKSVDVSRGHIYCSILVTPSLSNFFNGLHGGAVASIAERVSLACVKTVLSEDKHLFLGELSMTYLAAAPISSELVVEGSIVRSGKSMSVVNVEFKMKETKKVAYLSRATIYHNLISKL